MVNVFLPYADFRKSIECLDKKRLYKQLVECIQLLSVIIQGKKGFANHPVTKMWRNHTKALSYYAQICCDVLKEKYPVFIDSVLRMEERLIFDFGGINKDCEDREYDPQIDNPWFVGDSAFHDSHKSSLWHKNPQEYHQFEQFNTIKSYKWPVPVKKITIFTVAVIKNKLI